ncbi:LpxI family protein [Mariniblastus fucicola]|uniref:DUF1009 domain-containing protein n=1 Tax=Mariniblastus fucicola TaxID=980251 RepID=A0A5B9PCA3_9BACT|nr:UDP-2,3-diacylglucosamine diphosphatase LpxI [Mariniblastus fucicola]QEG22146.1 hypothetical protein MFFC18_20070 [Mariniblastus fucicola]
MPNATTTNEMKIGLIAGWGNFPVRVAESLVAQGYEVTCVAVKGHADPILKDICQSYREFGMGRMGSQVRYLRKAGIEQATMAGKIFKTVIFEPFFLLRHFPDLTFWRHFFPVFLTRTRDRKDDTLLTTVTELYASGGIMFAPATDFAPDLLIGEGVLTKRKPTESQLKDIDFGWTLAREMGRMDIGQSVVIKHQAALAIEAIEGTDECIARAGQLCKAGGFTVVKTAKPQQDMRFDVPTVGTGTIETIYKAGGKVLAIEAGRTIMLDQEETIALANKRGISIIARKD